MGVAERRLDDGEEAVAVGGMEALRLRRVESEERRADAPFERVRVMSSGLPLNRTKVKISIEHHSREVYVPPATMSSFEQPAR